MRSLTIRQDSSLQPIKVQEVRELPRNLTDLVDFALELVHVAFSECIPVECKVSIDLEEKMFILTFSGKQESHGEDLRLLVKRTVNVLEILRRPYVDCEPVTVNEQKLVWTRYDDIKYEGDAFLLKQWVERKEPYKYTAIELPPTANQFIDLIKASGLKISVQHDPSACPLRNVPISALVKKHKFTEGKVKEYLKYIEGPDGQPESFHNESAYSHGLCWRVSIESEETLPKDVRSIEEVALKGAALRTLLETGSLVFHSSEDEWTVIDFEIPEANELPREFNESIHLMEIRRREQLVKEEPEEPMFPGTFILEEWVPEIRLKVDRIVFKVTSQETGEEKIHEIFESAPNQMQPEKLEELLWKGMKELYGELELEENERMYELVQAEIEEYVEHVEDLESGTFHYTELSTPSDRAGVIEANFKSDDGEPLSVVVTQRIYEYEDWTELSGGIDPLHIENEVRSRLSHYDIDEVEIEKVIEAVKEFLEAKDGVRIKEQ